MGFLRRLFGGQPREAPSPAGGWRQLPIFDPHPTHEVHVVGESRRQEALELLAGGRADRGVVQREHVASLQHEPNNPADPNAVLVQINAHHVGYLGRDDAARYAPVLGAIRAMGYPAFGAHARLTGGWSRGPERGSIGVVLLMGTPAEMLAELGHKAEGIADLAESSASDPATTLSDPAGLELQPGAAIAFTGESACTVAGRLMSRDTQEILATNAGFVVQPRVTKATSLLVVSRSAPRTGKVTKAEQYGVPRIDEATFWRAIGVRIDDARG